MVTVPDAAVFVVLVMLAVNAARDPFIEEARTTEPATPVRRANGVNRRRVLLVLDIMGSIVGRCVRAAGVGAE